MNNYISNCNLHFEKYIYLFNKYENVQVIFFIPSCEQKNLLRLDKGIFDISGPKINKLETIGPFIACKKSLMNFDGNNLEEAIVRFYKKNRYYKWLGILNDKTFLPNIFKVINLKLEIQHNSVFIIPHRDREEQLNITLKKINEYIKINNLDSDIWVCQQNNFGNWNKGCNLNIGFLILYNFYNYFIFNDCDTYLENDFKIKYPNNNQINHYYGYNYCLGGIFCFPTKIFIQINGFNNNFFNWGREDRDLEDRSKRFDIKINRENFIKVNQNGVKQIEHVNSNNYWNYKDKNSDYYASRELYYFNQLENYNENSNGLHNLELSDYIDNKKILIVINLIEYSDGNIKIFFGEKKIEKLTIYIRPSYDTGILEVDLITNKFNLPINPEEKYPKIIIELTSKSFLIKVGHFLEKKIIIDLKEIITDMPNIEYSNIDLFYDLITTFFKDDKINYNYNVKSEAYFNQINITH